MAKKEIKAVGETSEELGVAPTPTTRYRLLVGRHARFRGGEYESFVAGDVVDLTPSEALRMASRIEEVAEDAAPEPPPAPVESKKAARRRREKRRAAMIEQLDAGVYPLCSCGHAHDAHRDAGDPRSPGCWLCPCAGYQPLAAEEAGR
jgi:hypothetical protein